MQQANDHFSTSSTSAAGSPATANLIQQTQPSAAQTAAAATTPTNAGSAEGAAGTDNNGHDYKTVRH